MSRLPNKNGVAAPTCKRRAVGVYVKNPDRWIRKSRGLAILKRQRTCGYARITRLKAALLRLSPQVPLPSGHAAIAAFLRASRVMRTSSAAPKGDTLDLLEQPRRLPLLAKASARNVETPDAAESRMSRLPNKNGVAVSTCKRRACVPSGKPPLPVPNPNAAGVYVKTPLASV